MKKYLLTLVFAVGALSLSGQTIVDALQSRQVGQGEVNVHQSAAIAALIGKRFQLSTEPAAQNVLKAKGYRVQVYAGNNSRVARNEATAVAEKVKEAFPKMPVYTYFQPPRWLCRVGDYKTMEEAYAAMLQLKNSGQFKEVAIVRENINIPMEE